MDAPHTDGGTREDTGFRPLLPDEAGPVPATVPAPPPLRIGRAEREVAEGRLRRALDEDVLSINEFDDRLGAVLASRTQAELDALLADLPARIRHCSKSPEPEPHTQSASRLRRWIVAVMSGHEQRGRWRPARPLNVVALMGGAVVDLRDAETDDGEFVVEAVAFMGGVDVIVPDNAEVDLGGFAFMGGRENKVPLPRSGDGPLVRVNGYALMGGVVVRTAKEKEHERFPASNQARERQWQRPPGPPMPAKPSVVGRVFGALLAVALILGPGRAMVTADEVVLFGGDEVQVTAARLEDGEDLDIFVMFGGMEVVVPDGTLVEEDVTAIFGGDDCESACAADGDAQLRVDGFVGFGGASILTETEFAQEERDLD